MKRLTRCQNLFILGTFSLVFIFTYCTAAWSAGSFSPTGSMGTARDGHTATLLPNGTVLIAGGYNSGSGSLATAELYDPVTGTFSPTGSMGTARRAHKATLLPNGTVLMAGGCNSCSGSLPTAELTAELYDPVTGTFSPTGSMGTARAGHTATLLANGKVLMAGGYNSGSSTLATTELYDPGTGTFNPTGSMGSARESHTATLLNSGKVLIAGGFNHFSFYSSDFFATAELYDPVAGTFSPTGSMGAARDGHTATLLPNGTVLMAGGFGSSSVSGSLATAELFDPGTGTFNRSGSMWVARQALSATLLPNGEVLVAGGWNPNASLATAELYDLAGLTTKLINISTRTHVQTGANRMIGGFIIGGTDPKTVMIRGRGPSMGTVPFNLTGVLANPAVKLYSGSTVIAQNDDWQTTDTLCVSPAVPCGGVTEITATGKDPCQPNPGQSGPPANCSKESAIYVTLPPGNYSAIVSGVGATSGLGLVEAFEVNSSDMSTLVNLSTRAQVQTGANRMIGGFIVSGNTPKTVLLRARGPSMGTAPFNLTGILADPTVKLYSGSTVIAQNDDWGHDGGSCVTPAIFCGGTADISSTGKDPCQPNPGQSGPPANCSKESAIYVTLPPGNYSAIVSGVGATSGLGLVEVFDIQ